MSTTFDEHIITLEYRASDLFDRRHKEVRYSLGILPVGGARGSGTQSPCREPPFRRKLYHVKLLPHVEPRIAPL